jgi:hypothetical protein
VVQHPNKHIRAAVEYALGHQWTLRKSGPRAHIWDACTVRKVIETDAQEQFIRHPGIPKTMQRIFDARLIAARMRNQVPETRKARKNDKV